MSIKTKLRLGLAFLFAVIVLLGGLGSYFIRQLAAESEAIMQDNYESLEYGKAMLLALSDVKSIETAHIFGQDKDSLAKDFLTRSLNNATGLFEKNLKAEENNITEAGEEEAVQALRKNYQIYISSVKKTVSEEKPSTDFYFSTLMPVHNAIQLHIHQILDVNMQAIVRKNTQAQQTASRVVTYTALIGTISVVVAFIFLATFPGYIANPIKALTQSIKQISLNNYDQKLNFHSQDEFGELASSFNTMAKKLDEYEHSRLAKTLFEKKRLDAIINNMSDAIIGLNENKIILFANTEATRLLGMEDKELVGKYAPDIASVNDLMRSLIQELMMGVNSNEKKEFQHLKIVVDNKESFFSKDILSVSTPKTGEDKHILIGHVIILRNITQFRELDAAKTNFIATISHELKTPISSIKMSLKLLEDKRVGKLNEEQQQLVITIKEESERLLKITGELLDLTQVETGNIQLDFGSVEATHIIDYASKALKFQADQKEIILDVKLASGLPNVYADLEKSAWVMVNLLSNAIRYSPTKNKIRIEAWPEEKMVVFAVKDSGKGIDPKYKERIFEKFFQVPENQKTGTGLGLAISKEFITAQGGKIWVDSEWEQGSTFYFTLPVAD